MNNDGSLERSGFVPLEQCEPQVRHRPLHLAQARAMLEAAQAGTRRPDPRWPVFVQDSNGTTLLRGQLPSLLAVQRLREDLADLGYRQVAGAAEGIYVFRLREPG